MLNTYIFTNNLKILKDQAGKIGYEIFLENSYSANDLDSCESVNFSANGIKSTAF